MKRLGLLLIIILLGILLSVVLFIPIVHNILYGLLILLITIFIASNALVCMLKIKEGLRYIFFTLFWAFVSGLFVMTVMWIGVFFFKGNYVMEYQNETYYYYNGGFPKPRLDVFRQNSPLTMEFVGSQYGLDVSEESVREVLNQ